MTSTTALRAAATAAPPLPAALRLGAVHLTVTDLDRSVGFYQDASASACTAAKTRSPRWAPAGRTCWSCTRSPARARRAAHAGLYHFALLHPTARSWRARSRASPPPARRSTARPTTASPRRSTSPTPTGTASSWPPTGRARSGPPDWDGRPAPLDLHALLGLVATEEPARHAGPGLTVGHLHLHVGDIERGLEFYRDLLGFEVQTLMPSAAFVSAGGYHHHLGFNIWRGPDVPPAPPARSGLREWTVVLPEAAQVDAAARAHHRRRQSPWPRRARELPGPRPVGERRSLHGRAGRARLSAASPTRPGGRSARAACSSSAGSWPSGRCRSTCTCPALPELADDLGAGASATQLTLTACLAGLALGQLVAGPLSDRFGRRRPLLVGVGAYAIASLLCAAAPSVPVLTGMRLVQGLAGAAGIVIARAVVRDLHSGAAAVRFFSLLMLVTGVAPDPRPRPRRPAARRSPTWRGIFVGARRRSAARCCSPSPFGLRETLPPERRSPGGPLSVAVTFRHVLSDRRFLGYALASGLAFGGLFAYVAGSPFVLQGIYGASPQTFSAIFGANSVGLVLASQVNGRLAGRVDPNLVLRAGMSRDGARRARAARSSSRPASASAAVLPPLFVMVSAMGIVLAQRRPRWRSATTPRWRAARSALLGVLQFLIGAAVAPLPGIAGTGTAVPMALVMAVLPVAGLICLLALTRPAPRLVTS